MNIRKITEQANQVSELNDINVTEAVSVKDMGFKPWNFKTPSFRIGRLEGVSADQLTKMFGPPKKGSGDGKSTMEWGFTNPQGLVFTVYDYRNPPASKSAPHNWSVGGVNKGHAASVQRAFKMMGVPGKMIKEETDPFMVGQTVSEWRDADTGDVMEGVSVMSGAEGMIKNDPAGGASMVSSFRKTKAALASKPAGSVLLLTKEKDPESMTLKIYEPKDFDSLMRGLSKKPEKKVGSKGSWSGGEVTVLGLKEEVEVSEQFKAGDKVKVPHKGKMVSGKIVRYDGGGTGKARQHGGGYVVDVGEPASVTVPKEKVRKEEVEVTEAINIGTKAYEIQMDMFSKKDQYILYRLSYGQGSVRFADGRKGTAIGTFKSKADAMAAAKKDAGVKESVEVEGEDLQEGKIKFSRILQGVKDMQGPFTIVVMKPTGPGALMQKKVSGRDALPAHINHMLANDLKGKAWKAIAIEGSSGGVLNVLFPKDVTKAESVEEGFAQPTQKELQKSIKWLEGLLKDPAKMKKSGLDLQDVKDNLRAARDFLDFGKKHASKINKESVEEEVGIEEATISVGKRFTYKGKGFVVRKASSGYEIFATWAPISFGMVNSLERSDVIKSIEDSNRQAGSRLRDMLNKMKEETEIDEASWGGGFQSSREAQAGVQASAKADAKRERMVLFSSIRAVMMGKMSKAEFKKKIGQSFDKISPLAKQKAMKVKEEVVDENTYTTGMGTKVTHIDYGQMAAEEAKKIKERAKQLGVQVLVQSSTSIAFVKSFTKGSMQEFFKAYRDCDRIRSMIKFKGNQNEWGCSTAGVGIGAQECVKSGKVMIYKSGSGAAGLLRKLEESLSDDEMLSRIDEAFGDLA